MTTGLEHATQIPIPGLPGRLWAGALPLRAATGSSLAVLQNLAAAGVQRIVCLVPEADLAASYGAPDYAEAARQVFGERFWLVGVEDYSVPDDPAPYRQAVRATLQALADDEEVLVHCGAGCGRTGTFVCCVLASAGMAAPQAIAYFLGLRGCGPETREQAEWIAAFGRGASGQPHDR